LARAADKDSPVYVGDLRPFDGITRPASCCQHEEAALIYATLTSVLSKKSPIRERALAICKTLDGELVLGDRTRELGAQYNAKGSEVLHSIVRNSLRSLRRRSERAEADMLVLPGRDVWAWEVLARRRRLTTVFDPVVSRAVAGNEKALSAQVKNWPVPDWSKALMFDTGFAGSIHRAVSKVVQPAPQLLMLSASDYMREKQLYPRHSGSRGKALAIEYIPKYWESGFVADGKPRQALAKLEEFVLAALTTIWLWHHQSKRWIERKKERAKKPSLQGVSDYLQQASNTTAQFWLPATGSSTGMKVVPLPTPGAPAQLAGMQELQAAWGQSVLEDWVELGNTSVTTPTASQWNVQMKLMSTSSATSPLGLFYGPGSGPYMPVVGPIATNPLTGQPIVG